MIQIGKATLHHGDCMEYLKDIPDNYYELAIVDPPYGIDVFARQKSAHKKSGEKAKYTSKSGAWVNYKPKLWDDSAPSKDYFDEILRVSKNQIIFGANVLSGFLPINKKWIVWHKAPDGLNHGKCDLAWTSFEGAVDYFKYFLNESNGFLKDKDFGRIHPTQKPVKLYEWLLNNYAKTGDKILDTHGGSFSSAIACNNLGFDFTGIELDKDYFDAAVKRVEAASKQIRMFA